MGVVAISAMLSSATIIASPHAMLENEDVLQRNILFFLDEPSASMLEKLMLQGSDDREERMNTFIPETINQDIAKRAAQIFVRQRMEGENDLGELVLAIVTEMQAFDFSKSFYGEFAIANAVSDLLLESLGIDKCCGQ